MASAAADSPTGGRLRGRGGRPVADPDVAVLGRPQPWTVLEDGLDERRSTVSASIAPSSARSVASSRRSPQVAGHGQPGAGGQALDLARLEPVELLAQPVALGLGLAEPAPIARRLAAQVAAGLVALVALRLG